MKNQDLDQDQTQHHLLKLVIHFEGGLVQAVYCNCETPLLYAVQDFDVNHFDEDTDLVHVETGQPFTGHIGYCDEATEHVEKVFTVINAHDNRKHVE